MNLTFTKVRTELFTLTGFNISLPPPPPEAQWYNPTLHFEFQGNRSQSLLRCSLIKMRAWRWRGGKCRHLIFAFSPLPPPLCSSEGLLMPLGGDLASGNPAAGALCKPPKEEVVEMNRPRGIPSEHQRNKSILRPKPNVTMGLSSHSRQNSGTNQALGFLDHILGGCKQQSKMERAWA